MVVLNFQIHTGNIAMKQIRSIHIIHVLLHHGCSKNQFSILPSTFQSLTSNSTAPQGNLWKYFSPCLTGNLYSLTQTDSKLSLSITESHFANIFHAFTYYNTYLLRKCAKNIFHLQVFLRVSFFSIWYTIRFGSSFQYPEKVYAIASCNAIFLKSQKCCKNQLMCIQLFENTWHYTIKH